MSDTQVKNHTLNIELESISEDLTNHPKIRTNMRSQVCNPINVTTFPFAQL